jgi:hypothetical protein
MTRGKPAFSFNKYLSLTYLWLYVLLFIVLIAVFFRFYGMPGRYVFDFDPTRDALISIVGETDFMFPLTGPKSGIAEFTFGPWYYYQIILFSILTPFQYAPWIYIGLTSVATVLVYFFIGKALFDKWYGLILAFIVAIATSEIGPVTGLSNPNLVPLHASLSVLFFVLFFKKKLSFFWILVWGFVIGVGINHHYQAVGLLFLPIAALIYSRKRIGITLLALSLGIFVSFVPLLIFNISENWHTLQGLKEYLIEDRRSGPNRWLTYLLEFWPMFWSYVWGVPLFVGIALALYVASVTMFAYVKKVLPISYILLFVVLIINIIFIRYATSIRENYYFLYLHPFLFIPLALSLWYPLKHRYVRFMVFVIAYIVFFFNFKEDVRRLKEENESRDIRSHVSILKGMYDSDITIYRCGDRVANIAQAMTFLLYHDERLSEDGKRIGLKSDQCRDKSAFKYIAFDDKNGYVIVDFEKFPKAREYWTLVTPVTVYRENLEWYK